MSKTYYGGQAVIEGVMMRGRRVYATAVRTPEGEIAVEKKDNETILGKYKLFTYPIFRGISAFLDSLIVGTKILMQSAVLAGEEETEEEPSKFEKKLMDKYGMAGELLQQIYIRASYAQCNRGASENCNISCIYFSYIKNEGNTARISVSRSGA